MEKRKKGITPAQVREEIRNLNLIGKSQIHRSFDEEAALDLVLRLGITTVPEVAIPPVMKYRLLVGGFGTAYEGESESEGRRQFSLYMIELKAPRSLSAGKPVTLFKGFEVPRRYSLVE